MYLVKTISGLSSARNNRKVKEKCREMVRLLNLTVVHYERVERLIEEANEGQLFIYSSKCSVLVSIAILFQSLRKNESIAMPAAL